ncbi:MAG: hypothetical protein LBP59_03540 [Planctomycetaceae bacterium]|nr:hypothetical protein [Planctomycetaceae bacterium]
MIVILLVLEIQRFKSVKACRPKSRQAKVNANSSTNSLKTLFLPNFLIKQFHIIDSCYASYAETRLNIVTIFGLNLTACVT